MERRKKVVMRKRVIEKLIFNKTGEKITIKIKKMEPNHKKRKRSEDPNNHSQEKE